MQRFSVVRKGYSPAEVDQAMEDLQKQLEERTTALETYRRREQEITEQEEAARQRADRILAQADQAAEKKMQEMLVKLQEVRAEALELRDVIEGFQREYNELLRQFLIRTRTEEFPALLDKLGAIIEQTGGENIRQGEEL